MKICDTTSRNFARQTPGLGVSLRYIFGFLNSQHTVRGRRKSFVFVPTEPHTGKGHKQVVVCKPWQYAVIFRTQKSSMQRGTRGETPSPGRRSLAVIPLVLASFHRLSPRQARPPSTLDYKHVSLFCPSCTFASTNFQKTQDSLASWYNRNFSFLVHL
jgi:hypothetical protein